MARIVYGEATPQEINSRPDVKTDFNAALDRRHARQARFDGLMRQGRAFQDGIKRAEGSASESVSQLDLDERSGL
jgi:hypothetical protein